VTAAAAFVQANLHFMKMSSSKFQYTRVEESEPVVEGYGPARRVYTGKGPLVTLPPGVSNLHENFLRGVSLGKDGPFLGHRVITNGVAGVYEWQSYNQVHKRVLNLGSAFANLGLSPNSNVGLFSVNRPEWVIAEHACFTQGLVTVPLYDTLGPDAIKYILNLTETPLVVATADKARKLVDLANEIQTIKHVVVMDTIPAELQADADKAGVNLHLMTDLEKMGEEKPAPKYSELNSESVATLCFTSGTTGLPKGVILSHGNLLAFVSGAHQMGIDKHMYQFSIDDVHISYLPLAHIFERVVQATLLYYGAACGFYQGDTLKLLDDVAELKPTIFVSVPRLYNKIYDKVMAGVKAKGGLAATLFNMGFESKKENLKNGQNTHWFWDALVFKKIKARLGGRVKIMMTGAAPISSEVVEFLKIGFCCPVVEGYGQSENSACATTNILVDPTSGHIGVPQPAMLVKLRDVPSMNYFSTDKPYPRGEICIKGAAVFKGYYKAPEKTAETLSSDGWLYSGDIGQWDEQGRLKIIDRVKNIFKLAQGEYIGK
jgi:long-chain acyl-CoA synthetase